MKRILLFLSLFGIIEVQNIYGEISNNVLSFLSENTINIFLSKWLKYEFVRFIKLFYMALIHNKFKILFILIYIFFPGIIFSQAPGCPSVDVGPDTTIGCSSCVLLSADYFNVGQTSSYSVSSTLYAPPYPFLGGTQLFIGVDDILSRLLGRL